MFDKFNTGLGCFGRVRRDLLNDLPGGGRTIDQAHVLQRESQVRLWQASPDCFLVAYTDQTRLPQGADDIETVNLAAMSVTDLAQRIAARLGKRHVQSSGDSKNARHLAATSCGWVAKAKWPQPSSASPRPRLRPAVSSRRLCGETSRSRSPART